MKNLALLLLVPIASLGAAACAAESSDDEELVDSSEQAQSVTPLAGLRSGSYALRGCGIGLEAGLDFTVRKLGRRAFVVVDGYGDKPVAEVRSDGTFTGAGAFSFHGAVTYTRGLLHVRFDQPTGGIAAVQEADGDYDVASRTARPCAVERTPVRLTGTVSSHWRSPYETSHAATLHRSPRRMALSLDGDQDYRDVPLDEHGRFDHSRPNPNGGSHYLRVTAEDGVVDVAHGYTSNSGFAHWKLFGFYEP